MAEPTTNPTNPTPEPPKKRHVGRWIVTGLIGLAVIGHFGGSDASAPEPTTVHSAPAPSLAKPKPATPPAPAPEPEASDAAKVAAWWTTAETPFSTLRADLDGDLTDAATYRTLQRDITALRAAGPVPVAKVNRPWQRMLNAYDDGFSLAEQGITSYDAATIRRAATRINQANTYAGQATDAVAALGVLNV